MLLDPTWTSRPCIVVDYLKQSKYHDTWLQFMSQVGNMFVFNKTLLSTPWESGIAREAEGCTIVRLHTECPDGWIEE
jgi:hypothetical protein